MVKWKEQGYTLLEVLIALGILGFGLLAVASMQATAIKANAVASNMSQALTVAEAKAEELMNLPYDHSFLSDTDSDGTDQDADDDGIDDDGGNFGLDDVAGADGTQTKGIYAIYWNVAMDEPASNSKKIRVMVTWTERGKSKRIALDFVRTNLS
jgi:type IV pilus assembly protein PilV